MNKKIWIPIVLVGLLLLGGIAYLYRSLDEQKKVNQDMQELAELDKKEMQNEYEQFALYCGTTHTGAVEDAEAAGRVA